MGTNHGTCTGVVAANNITNTMTPTMLVTITVSDTAIADCVITVDGLNSQKKAAQQIVSQGGDNILALERNHAHVSEDVRNPLVWAAGGDFAEMQRDTCTLVGKEARTH